MPRSRTLQSATLGGLLLALLLVMGPGAVAQESEAASCARLADDTERLACYDRLFRPGGEAVETEALTITSERLIPALPTGRAPAEMTVACAEGVLTVQFRFAGQLVSVTGDIAPITFQIDQNATAVRSLGASSDNTTLGFRTSSEAEAFIGTLAGGRNLRVRVTPVRQRSLTVDFRIVDHYEQILQLRDACR